MAEEDYLVAKLAGRLQHWRKVFTFDPSGKTYFINQKDADHAASELGISYETIEVPEDFSFFTDPINIRVETYTEWKQRNEN